MSAPEINRNSTQAVLKPLETLSEQWQVGGEGGEGVGAPLGRTCPYSCRGTTETSPRNQHQIVASVQTVETAHMLVGLEKWEQLTYARLKTLCARVHPHLSKGYRWTDTRQLQHNRRAESLQHWVS